MHSNSTVKHGVPYGNRKVFLLAVALITLMAVAFVSVADEADAAVEITGGTSLESAVELEGYADDDVTLKGGWYVINSYTIAKGKTLTLNNTSIVVVKGTLYLNKDSTGSDNTITPTSRILLDGAGGSLIQNVYTGSISTTDRLMASDFETGEYLRVTTESNCIKFHGSDIDGSAAAITKGTITANGHVATNGSFTLESGASIVTTDGYLNMSGANPITILGSVAVSSFGSYLYGEAIVGDGGLVAVYDGGVLGKNDDIDSNKLTLHCIVDDSTSAIIVNKQLASEGVTKIVASSDGSTDVTDDYMMIEGTLNHFAKDEGEVAGKMTLQGLVKTNGNMSFGPNTEVTVKNCTLTVPKNNTFTLASSNGTYHGANWFENGVNSIFVDGTFFTKNPQVSLVMNDIIVNGLVTVYQKASATGYFIAAEYCTVDNYTVYHYASLPHALENSLTSNNKTVTVMDDLVRHDDDHDYSVHDEVNMVVPKGVIVKGDNDVEIRDSASIILSDGSDTSAVTIKSEMVVEGEDRTVYSGVLWALRNSKSGEVATVTSNFAGTTIDVGASAGYSIKDGVTFKNKYRNMEITKAFNVYGNLEISGKTLKLKDNLNVLSGGSVVVSGAGAKFEMTADKVMTTTDGIVKIISGASSTVAGVVINAAYYNQGSAYYYGSLPYVMNVQNANDIVIRGSLNAGSTETIVPSGVKVTLGSATTIAALSSSNFTVACPEGGTPGQLIILNGSVFKGIVTVETGAQVEIHPGGMMLGTILNGTSWVLFNADKKDSKDVTVFSALTTVKGIEVGDEDAVRITGSISSGVVETTGLVVPGLFVADKNPLSTDSKITITVVSGRIVADGSSNSLVIGEATLELGKYGSSYTPAIEGKVDLVDGKALFLAYPNADLTKMDIGDAASTMLVYVTGGVETEYVAEYAFTESGSVPMTLPTLSKSGYTFSGWYTQPTGGEKITSSSVGKYEKLYAQYTASEHTVKVTVPDGLRCTIDAVPVTESGDVKLSTGNHALVMEVKEGYTGTPTVKATGITYTANTTDKLKGTLSVTSSGTLTMEGVMVKKDPMPMTEILLIVIAAMIALMFVALMYTSHRNRVEMGRSRNRRRR